MHTVNYAEIGCKIFLKTQSIKLLTNNSLVYIQVSGPESYTKDISVHFIVHIYVQNKILDFDLCKIYTPAFASYKRYWFIIYNKNSVSLQIRKFLSKKNCKLRVLNSIIVALIFHMWIFTEITRECKILFIKFYKNWQQDSLDVNGWFLFLYILDYLSCVKNTGLGITDTGTLCNNKINVKMSIWFGRFPWLGCISLDGPSAKIWGYF